MKFTNLYISIAFFFPGGNSPFLLTHTAQVINLEETSQRKEEVCL